MSKVDYLKYNFKSLDDLNINNYSLKNVKIDNPSEYKKNVEKNLENNKSYSLSNISLNNIDMYNKNMNDDKNKYSFDFNLNLLTKNYREKYRSNNLLNFFYKE